MQFLVEIIKTWWSIASIMQNLIISKLKCWLWWLTLSVRELSAWPSHSIPATHSFIWNSNYVELIVLQNWRVEHFYSVQLNFFDTLRAIFRMKWKEFFNTTMKLLLSDQASAAKICYISIAKSCQNSLYSAICCDLQLAYFVEKWIFISFAQLCEIRTKVSLEFIWSIESIAEFSANTNLCENL